MDAGRLDSVVTRVVTGAHLGLSAPSIFGIVAASDQISRAMFARTDPSDEGLSETLAYLTRPDNRDRFSFAFARLSGATAIVVIGGAGQADVTIAAGSTEIAAHSEESDESISEFGFDDVVGLTLHIAHVSPETSRAVLDDDPGDEEFNVRLGVAPATRLVRRDARYHRLPTEAVGTLHTTSRAVDLDTVRIDRDAAAWILAIPCPAGHMNPTHAMRCRVCDESVETTLPILVERRSLGTLVFSDGQRVPLDGPLVIGRDPDVVGSAPPPRIVKFENAGKGLSRTHAAVLLEGWQVLIEDRRSTNGTEVTLPGQTPRRLRSGEPAVLVPGAEIDFGGAIRCVMEMG